jgi:hypothetical protein
MYFIRLGFLDGYEGYLYCSLLSAYEKMIAAKVDEIRRSSPAGSVIDDRQERDTR